MLGCVTNTFKLCHLREINIIPKMLWQIKSACDVVNHFVIAVHTLLMRKEHRTVEVIIGLVGKNANTVHIGKRFKAEFTAKTGHTLSVIVHRFQAVPYAPKVSITHIIGIHALIMTFTDRRTLGIRSLKIVFSDFSFKNFVEKLFCPRNILRHIYPCHVHILNFVVAAPQCK